MYPTANMPYFSIKLKAFILATIINIDSFLCWTIESWWFFFHSKFHIECLALSDNEHYTDGPPYNRVASQCNLTDVKIISYNSNLCKPMRLHGDQTPPQALQNGMEASQVVLDHWATARSCARCAQHKDALSSCLQGTRSVPEVAI